MSLHGRLVGVFRHARRGRVQLGALALLIAFLPTLTFAGHWDDVLADQRIERAPVSALTNRSSEQAEHAEHAQHCHMNLASCSAQPLPSGLGFLKSRDWLLSMPVLLFALRTDSEIRLPASRFDTPQPPPPRTFPKVY